MDIYVIHRPGGSYREKMPKTVPEVLSTAQGRRPRAVLKTEGRVFPYTDRPRPVNNVFIFFCNFGGETRRVGLRTVCKQSTYVR